MAMDAETKQRIEMAVVEILKSADMDEATEYKVRAAASEKLGLDLSPPDRKLFVRSVVESFLLSNNSDAADAEAEVEAEADPEAEEKEDGKSLRKAKEYDDDGDLIICRLSNKRKVTIQDFKGRTLVSIREYYEKGGKELPSSKGISLTAEQWKALSKAVPAIEDAIKKLEGSD